SPGTVETLNWPSGPGVRVDSGVVSGDTISGMFDSMLAKIIVTGATRDEALARARRALGEATITGLPTVLDFHRAVVAHPDFADSFRVHTTWIESQFLDSFTPPQGTPPPTSAPVD